MENISKSVYIHIPFCKNICHYCDFCKMYYQTNWIDKYLEALKKEVITNYKGELIKTIYIGGGTPSCLNLEELKNLFLIIKLFKKSPDLEFTFECNIEDITLDKLKLLSKNGVNRISIGIQTFNKTHQKFINRENSYNIVLNKINLIKKYFNNINLDLMYGFENQTLKQLEKDINLFLKLDVNHISTYSLIIEPHTKFYIDKIKSIDEDLDYKMYQLINKKLLDSGFEHYEISNYSKKNYKSKHNLTYWNNEHYYGFGLGASGYINNIRYDNTRNLNKYLKGDYVFESHKLSLKETMENELILGLRKINGVNRKIFFDKYKRNIEEVFDIKKLLIDKKLIKKNNYYFINKDYLYLSNDILINFID